ncbi:hypothetical protein PG987_007433 [Apiospora arundinis]
MPRSNDGNGVSRQAQGAFVNGNKYALIDAKSYNNEDAGESLTTYPTIYRNFTVEFDARDAKRNREPFRRGFVSHR